ncbi:GntR family transcriptional regulator [Pseudonocardia tropica]|uniref:GntR family transcriptional regulator n=1 Tax=Pseudonocardia tropica TaxID=681289 RepID=A0ABV1K2T4_9PSEU
MSSTALGPAADTLGGTVAELWRVVAVAPRGTSHRIAEDLRHRIRDGALVPGSLLPSEAQLCEQYDVARGTARAALAVLVDEGVVEVVPGVGRRVAGGDGADRTTAYGRIAADLTEQIRAGTLAPDAPLPSEATVMEQYGVSRNTARRAFKVLADSGVVVVRHGVGAFVRSAES